MNELADPTLAQLFARQQQESMRGDPGTHPRSLLRPRVDYCAMGLTRIRSSAVRSANDDRYFKKVLKLIDGADTPGEIINRCEREAKRMGLKVTTKSSTSLKWSKMTTTFYREIRLGVDFDDEPEWAQAVIWCHEMVHVYQWRGMGRVGFARRYAWRVSRWWIEMQAYRMSIHVRKLLKVNHRMTERYIRAKPSSLRGGYALGGLRWKHLRDKTSSVLFGELEKKRAA